MALEFETLVSVGKFGDTCETPIMDLRPFATDEVLRSIPRFIGRWEDTTEMQVLLDENYNIATAATDCDYSIASHETQSCTVVLPDQKLVAIGLPSSSMVYTQLLKRFCNAKGLIKFPTLFDSGGSFAPADEVIGEQFIVYILSELRSAFMAALMEYGWNGDATVRHQFDGILTQLTNGPTPAGAGCSTYEAVTFDWNTLVAGAGSVSSPSATIDAGEDSQTIHGVTFTGLTGLNYVEFLKLWIERLVEFDLERWASLGIEFELWVGKGQVGEIANLAACLQPCAGCVDPLSDPDIRNRAEQFRKEKRIWLYPWDNYPITIRTSPKLINQAIFLPKMIGQRPTTGWVFRDMIQQAAILEGRTPWFGSQAGTPDATFLYDDDEFMGEADQFWQRAITLNLQRNGNCVEAWMNVEVAMLLFGLHTWLVMNNINSTSLTPQTVYQNMGISATVCATVVGQPTQLDLTVAALEAYGAVGAGDTYMVYPADGTTALLATTVSYNTGTDVLRVDFGVNVDCNTGGGMSTALVVKHYDN